jgi:aconitate hydratase
MFHKEYAAVFEGDESWKAIQIPQSKTYEWEDDSTYIRHPPFLRVLISRQNPLPILISTDFGGIG